MSNSNWVPSEISNDTSNDIFNDISNDTSNDISNDTSNDISNDTSNNKKTSISPSDFELRYNENQDDTDPFQQNSFFHQLNNYPVQEGEFWMDTEFVGFPEDQSLPLNSSQLSNDSISNWSTEQEASNNQNFSTMSVTNKLIAAKLKNEVANEFSRFVLSTHMAHPNLRFKSISGLMSDLNNNFQNIIKILDMKKPSGLGKILALAAFLGESDDLTSESVGITNQSWVKIDAVKLTSNSFSSIPLETGLLTFPNNLPLELQKYVLIKDTMEVILSILLLPDYFFSSFTSHLNDQYKDVASDVNNYFLTMKQNFFNEIMQNEQLNKGFNKFFESSLAERFLNSYLVQLYNFKPVSQGESKSLGVVVTEQHISDIKSAFTDIKNKVKLNDVTVLQKRTIQNVVPPQSLVENGTFKETYKLSKKRKEEKTEEKQHIQKKHKR